MLESMRERRTGPQTPRHYRPAPQQRLPHGQGEALETEARAQRRRRERDRDARHSAARPRHVPARRHSDARKSQLPAQRMPDDIVYSRSMLVGSYAQPDWLIDRARLDERLPPRVRAKELWRIAPTHLEEAQNDATLVALFDQHRAGRRRGDRRRDAPGELLEPFRDGARRRRPRPARRSASIAPANRCRCRASSAPVRRLRVGRSAVHRVSQGAHQQADQGDAARPVHDDAAGAERLLRAKPAIWRWRMRRPSTRKCSDLFAAGVDIVQLDEPYVQARPEAAREYAVAAIDRALRGATGTTALHVCFGYGKHVANKPNGYAFCEELDACAADDISLECAQPRARYGSARTVAVETHSRRRARSARSIVESPEIVAQRIRDALQAPAAGTPRGRARLRHEIPAARRGVRQAAQHGARARHRPRRTEHLNSFGKSRRSHASHRT